MDDTRADDPAAGRAGIRTFLIADVRGYTLFTQQRGDEAAAKLASRFAGIAREIVEDHGGSVIELRGDEALAVFDSVRQAIRAAARAQERFLEETQDDPSYPLAVGIGLDAGEAVPLEKGYRGGALNLAARLCGRAGPGEILASQAAVHLAQRVEGVRYVDRGDLHFKGLADPVRVFRVVSEDGDPAVRIRVLAPRPATRGTAPIRLARQHPALAAVAALALVAAIAVPTTVALRGASRGERIAGDAVGVLDLESVKLTGSVRLESRPGDVAVGEGAVWVTMPDRGAVVQIDPETRTIRDTIPVGADPAGIAVGAGSVWVTNGGSSTVSRISPETKEVVQTIDVPGGPAGIAAGQEGIWVANNLNSSVSHIDPESGDVLSTIGVGDRPADIAVDQRGVWVANVASGTVSRITPTSDLVEQETKVGNGPQTIAAGPGGIWVANSLDRTISRIDPHTDAVTQTIRVGGEPTGLTQAGGFVWVSDGSRGSVERIQPGSGSVTTIPLGSQAAEMAVGDGAIWVSVRGSEASHRGGTLTVLAPRPNVDTLDPAVAYYPGSWAILSLTNDGLVGFRRTGGLDGTTLVPDLARTLPEPTDGGRAYTFQLRPGIRYSTGEPVRPDDFRRAIERVFANLDAQGNPSGGVPYYSGIVGAAACRPGHHCDLSGGISADDEAGTVTFHLTEADPDFLYKLTMPFAFAIPAETPDALGGDASLPATGPYVVETYSEGKQIVLARNSRFGSWSEAARPEGFSDRIVWRLSADSGEMAADVLAGDADLMFWFPEPESFAELASEHAAQLQLAPQPAIFYMSLDTLTPPFDDVRVRRAVNFAVDRAKVARLIGYGTRPTCQVLPPNFPGYEAYCPYTRDPGAVWTAPDLEAARELVDASGTAGMKVTVWAAPDWFPRVSAYFRDLLELLGYRATLKAVANRTYQSALYGKPRQAQVAFEGWYTDYPAESGFIGILACRAPGNTSGFCAQDIDKRMHKAERSQITDLAAAHRLWSAIEHDIVDQAPWVPLVGRYWVNLVSQRLGNFQVNPLWGPLIDQMWVR